VTTTVGRAGLVELPFERAHHAVADREVVEPAAAVVGPGDAQLVVPAQSAPRAADVIFAREGAVELLRAQRVVVPAGRAAKDDAADVDGRRVQRGDAGARAAFGDVALVLVAARRSVIRDAP
jgi:hypothetical protein